MYSSQTSITHIEKRFPELSEQLQDELWDDLLHSQISVFSCLAQKAIDDGNSQYWQKISQTFLELWRNCTPEVKNALNVSFLENLNFNDGKKPRLWAYHAMPLEMRKAWDEMEAYNQKLYES